MIDERKRRWGDWRYGQPVNLPDGQQWHFYEPTTVVRDGSPGWSFDAPTPEVDAELSHRFRRLITKWGRATDDSERASAILEAAWFLLARNYCITQEEFAAIMAGASAWDNRRQEALGDHLVKIVGGACIESAALLGGASWLKA